MNKKIVWQDYNANFVDNDDEELELENLDEDDSDFDDVDENEDGSNYTTGIAGNGIGFFNFTKAFSGVGPNVVQGPFGAFDKNNKWAPFNFYELKLIHLYGFSSNSDPSFGIKLDSVDGVAAWRSIDPYCFIIAKARLYEWSEVKLNIEIMFGIRTEESEKIKQSILEINNKGPGYIGVIYPNGEYTLTSYTEDEIDRIFNDCKSSIESLHGSKILLDGEIYFEN